MKTFNLLGIALLMIMFISCGKRKHLVDTTPTTVDTTNTAQKYDYIMDPNLSLASYSEHNGYFPKDGFIADAGMAFQIAEIILKKIYGSENIENQKPFSVKLENDIWLIEGHLDDGYLGGVAYIEIRKSNGEILKVIHGK